jgi:hypothetical protein
MYGLRRPMRARVLSLIAPIVGCTRIAIRTPAVVMNPMARPASGWVELPSTPLDSTRRGMTLKVKAPHSTVMASQ